MATAAVNRSDEQIQKDVLSKLKWDPVVRPNAVGMAVKDGEVPLRSWVDSYTYRPGCFDGAGRCDVPRENAT